MLSLPLIAPQDDPSFHLHTPFRPRPDSPPPSASLNNSNPAHAQQARQAQQRRDIELKAHNARSPLALLAADEAAIAARKAAIRNFGAYWIRPPGVAKTLQAMHEEEQEQREAEEAQRQEQGLMDMQAQQQLAEARERGADAEAEGGEEGEEERDLDEDIPDADADEAGEGEVTEEGVSCNEDSMVNGNTTFVSQPDAEAEVVEEDEQEALEMEEAELLGTARDEEDLGIERDLDDSVPEAGSYQHTDTEIEDTDSDSELQDSFAHQSTRRRSARSHVRRSADPREWSVSGSATGLAHPLQAQPQGMGSLQERMRAQVGAADALPRSPGSLNLSSSVLESSFVGSSPVLQRGAQGGRVRGGGARRGRGG